MRLAYSIFYSRDLDHAKALYHGVLKLPIAEETKTFVGFSIGDAIIGVKLASEPREQPGHQTVIIQVDDIDQLFDELHRSGAHIYSRMERADWGKNFSILDADDNRVEFVQAN